VRFARPAAVGPDGGTGSFARSDVPARREFDVIHAHIDWLHLPLLRPARASIRHHTAWALDLRVVGRRRRFPDAPFVSISNNQRVPPRRCKLGWQPFIMAWPADMSAAFEPGSYLAFLGPAHRREGA